MLGSSIKLSLLSRRTSKVQLTEIPRVKNLVQIERNATFDPFLKHALHIRRHVTPRSTIEMKRKRALSLSTVHRLSIDTIFVQLTALVK